MATACQGALGRCAALLALVGALAALSACPVRGPAVEPPGGEADAGRGGSGPAGGAAELELGDGGASLGRPGLAMFMGGSRHRGRFAVEGPAHTPEVVWTFHTGARIFASPAIGPDGTIYVGSVDGTFNAVSSAGQLLWSYAASAPIFSSAAVSDAGHVYVGCDDGTFLAFHPSGRVLWSDRREHAFDASPVIGDDGTVYMGGDGLLAYTPRGGLRWRARTAGHVFSPPVVHPRQVVVFGTDTGELLGADVDGRVVFRAALGSPVPGGPTVLETGLIVVASSAGDVLALDRAGTTRWRVRLDDEGVRSTPAVGLDGNVYVSADSGRLYALDPDTGQVRWRFQTGGPLRASPIVDAAGRVVVGSEDRSVYALDAAGELLWQLRLGGEIDSTGAIGPDGTYYCGCDDGDLYALR
jgi:outer membrane protein assembly factor BamB